jgi:hypothetical protein
MLDVTRGSIRSPVVLFALIVNVLAVVLRGSAQVLLPLGTAPVQPVAFSHKVHAGTVQLPCAMCHPNPDPGERMTLPPASLCLQCHETIKADSPEIAKLTTLTSGDREVPWVRVYQIPTYVFFSHRAHLDAGSTCADCHGPVAERDVIAREGDITMAGCMNCHTEKGASLDCGFCHQPYGE